MRTATLMHMLLTGLLLSAAPSLLADADEPLDEPVAVEASAEPVASEPSSQPADDPAAASPAAEAPASQPAAEEAPTVAAVEQAATQPSASQPATTVTTAPATRPRPGEPLTLNFQEASLHAVLEYLSEAAGLVVVQDTPRIDGRITVLSRQPVSVDEAVALLDTVLKAKGYAAIRIGRTLKIVTIAQAKTELIPVRHGNDPAQIRPSDQMVTQIIPIRYADAARLRTDLASLLPTGADMTANAASNALILTSTEATIRRIVEIISALDTHMSEVTQVKVFQLKYANAANAARLITDIFGEGQPARGQTTPAQRGGRAFTRGGGAGGPGGFGGPGAAGAAAASDQEGAARAGKVTVSSDDRTNTLVVSASPDILKVIEDVIHELDSNPVEERSVFIYHLRNGRAENIESILNTLFGWSGQTARAGVRTVGGTIGAGGALGAGGAFGSRTGGGSTGGFGGTTGGSARTSGSQARTTGGTQARTTGGFAGGTSRGLSAGTVAAASDLAGQVYVVADPDTNSLLVSTGSNNFERVKQILMDLDRPVPQVLIKVLIAEVTHENALDLGIEFSALNLRANGQGITFSSNFNVASQSGGLVVRMVEDDFNGIIRALATTAKLDVLSRPYILTSDNQQASILVGQEVPFITNTRTTETGQTINTIQYDDIGIMLTVTPHINPQGLVTLDVMPEISTLSGETVPISETLNAPVFAKRSAQTRVAILDGQTIVIGGLMEDRITERVEKIPLLGDIPLAGALFRRTVQNKSKTELLIFLTPHVAPEPESLQGMSKDELEGAKAVQGAVDPETFQRHMQGMERGAASRPATTQPVDRSTTIILGPGKDKDGDSKE